MSCVLCGKTAKERKYFFPGEPLCDEHYAGYLEYVIDGFEDEMTSSEVSSAFEKYKISLVPKPKPIIKPMPKPSPSPYSSPYKMGM